MDRHSSLIGEILKIPEARDAIEIALQEEIAASTRDLRTAAQDGNPVRSALIEGRIRALEEVPAMLTRFAEKAKSHQEQ